MTAMQAQALHGVECVESEDTLGFVYRLWMCLSYTGSSLDGLAKAGMPNAPERRNVTMDIVDKLAKDIITAADKVSDVSSRIYDLHPLMSQLNSITIRLTYLKRLINLQAENEQFQQKIVDIQTLINMAINHIKQVRNEREAKDAEPQVQNIGSLVMELVTKYGLIAESQGKTLLPDFVLDQVQGMRANISAFELTQILIELVSNSIKYGNRNLFVSVDQQNGFAIIKVKDDGIGIPAAEQQLIFKKEYRGTNTGNYTGSGIGLYRVHKIIQGFQNIDPDSIAIDLVSDTEGGTTFTITIKLLPEPTNFAETATNTEC
jgi:type VII secretion effector (TIGR04197 family)